MMPSNTSRPARRSGFTLIELLVVIFIIGLLAVSTLPVIVPTLQQNSIDFGARQLHAELSRQRDQAVRTNRPAGIRLLPDEQRRGPDVLTASRMVAIEQGPDYAEGYVHYSFSIPNGLDDDGDGTIDEPDELFYFPSPALPDPTVPPFSIRYPYLVVHEEKFDEDYFANYGIFIPHPPTSWFGNVRQGDKIRLNDSGRTYTIAGPVVNSGLSVPPGASISDISLPPDAQNPHRYVTFNAAGLWGPSLPGPPASWSGFDFLFLMNGQDDDGDGFIDEAFDGINNDGDYYPQTHPLAGRPCIDPGFNGIDDDRDGLIDNFMELFLHFNTDESPIYVFPYDPFTGEPISGPITGCEFEFESLPAGSTAITRSGEPVNYKIERRPVAVAGAREIALPTGIVIDLTTWDSGAQTRPVGMGDLSLTVPERSRLPVDPYTLSVDILLSPNGSVIQKSANANPAPQFNFPFFHFWLTDADGLNEPFSSQVMFDNNIQFRLPMPAGTNSDPSILDNNGQPFNIPYTLNPPLRGSRRLVSLNTKTGQIITTSLEQFATNNPSKPYQAAERGQQEEP